MAKKTVLLVEDDPHAAELVRYVLNEELPDFHIEPAARLSSALASLGRHDVAGVVSDLNLPDSQGADTVRHLLRAAPDVPIVVMTSQADCDLTLECIREGADEVVVKGTVGLHDIGQVTRLAFERRRRMRERWSTPERVTGEFGDRTAFESIAPYFLGVADRAGLHIVILVLRVESTAELPKGDGARLAAVTAVLERTVRRCDMIARLDTDEVGVVLVMQQPDPREVVARLARTLASAGGDPPVRLGMAIYRSGGTETLTELLGRARTNLQPLRA